MFGRASASNDRRRNGRLLLTAVAILGLAAAALAIGCGGKQVSLGPKDNGTTVNAGKGDTIVLKLDENPTTGYRWTLSFSSGLKVTSDKYKQQAGTQTMVGAGGTHTWYIDVTGSGPQTITGAYARSWEPASKAAGHFTVTLQVQ